MYIHMYRFTYSHRYILYIYVIRAYAHLIVPFPPFLRFAPRRKLSPLLYGFVSTTGALNILVLATAVAQLAIRAVSGRIFRSEPWDIYIYIIYNWGTFLVLGLIFSGLSSLRTATIDWIGRMSPHQ